MDHQAIRQQMPTWIAGQVPSNVRRCKFNIFDGIPRENMLGFRVEPSPFEGKVVAKTDEAIVVKTGRAEFAVLVRALITEVPEEGAKVEVIPNARRRFDRSEEHTSELQSLMRNSYSVFCLKKQTYGTMFTIALFRFTPTTTNKIQYLNIKVTLIYTYI